jgi:hypothetical protein
VRLDGADDMAPEVVERYRRWHPQPGGAGADHRVGGAQRPRRLDAELLGGTELYLGTDDIEMRFRRLLAAYPQVEAIGIPTRIDLRYSNGFAVRWVPRTATRRRARRRKHFSATELTGMARRNEKNLLVGLDIGTSKVAALVGELKADDTIEIIGIGTHPSHGLKKGVVVDIESTVQSIQRAVEEAELMAGCEIHSVHAGIAGSHVRSLNSHGITAIKDHEVVQADVDRVIDAARAVAIPADQKILHILPQEFIIDDQEGIREPIGMSGVRLEARVHMVTGAVSAAQNIVKCIRRCGLEVDDLVLGS